MKHLYFYCLFLLFLLCRVFVGYAQAPNIQQHIQKELAKLSVIQKYRSQDSLFNQLFEDLKSLTPEKDLPLAATYCLSIVQKNYPNQPNCLANAYQLLAKSQHYLDATHHITQIEAAIYEAYRYKLQIDPCGAINTIGWLGVVYTHATQKRYDEALALYEKYYQSALSKKCYNEAVNLLLEISNHIYLRQYKYPNALEYKLLALKIADSLPVSLDTKIVVQEEIALLHFKVRNYESATRFWHQTLPYNQKHGTRDLLHNYNNLGLAYRVRKQYDSAIYYFNATVDAAILQKDTIWVAIAKGNIGDVFIFQKKYAQALPYIIQDYKTSLHYQDWTNACAAGLELATIYAHTQRLDEALATMDSIETLFKAHQATIREIDEHKFWVLQASMYSDKATIFKQMQRWEDAFMHKEMAFKLQDSMRKFQQGNRLQEIQNDYQLKQKEWEKILLQQETDFHKYINIAVIVAALLALVALLALLRLYRLRHQRIVLEKDKAQQAELIAEEKRRNVELQYQLENEKSEALQLKLAVQEEAASLKEQQLLQQEREMTLIAMNAAQKNAVLEEVVQKLQEAGLPEKYTSLVKDLQKSLQQNIKQEEDWQTFRIHFDNVHPNFTQKLKTNFNSLTELDLRHAAYVRMGLTTKEVSNMLGQSIRTVEMAKYRLKKKLNLGEEDGLQDFLKAI